MPLLIQIILKLITLILVVVCARLKIDAKPEDFAESATWIVSALIAVGTFVWTCWRHHVALKAAKTPIPTLPQPQITQADIDATAADFRTVLGNPTPKGNP